MTISSRWANSSRVSPLRSISGDTWWLAVVEGTIGGHMHVHNRPYGRAVMLAARADQYVAAL